MALDANKLQKISDGIDGLCARMDAFERRADSATISKSALKSKLEGMAHAKLMSALNNGATDPAVKKMIEKELDDRANRGTSRGHGEPPPIYSVFGPKK